MHGSAASLLQQIKPAGRTLRVKTKNGRIGGRGGCGDERACSGENI